MTIGLTIASIFVLAALAPLLVRFLKDLAPWVMALLPLGLAVYFASLFGRNNAFPIIETVEWVPTLGINLPFYVDGLALMMAILVTGIGSLIVVYAGGYLHDDPRLGEFYSYLFLFMGAMLGVVLSGNIMGLFIFWELTSISSFLLIGYKHEYESSKRSALQALLITGGGGLALLAGLVLLGVTLGGFDFGTILLPYGADTPIAPGTLRTITLLVLAGAFTKSAQVPFHFWLPDAMAAPTPVSAYLHSATMVKAGIYLLARLSPTLAHDNPTWTLLVPTMGALTMVIGGFLAWQNSDLKRILAYSTLSVLGTITMLLGVGTKKAVEGAVIFIIAHALYKGALFMSAGAIDHETGTREIDRLRGLRTIMPFIFVAVMVASLSQAGIPFLLGFIGKEELYAAYLELLDGGGAALAGWAVVILLILSVLGNAMVGTSAMLTSIVPFFGRKEAADFPKTPHRAPVSLWLGPIVLGVGSLAFGIAPQLIAFNPISTAMNSILGEPEVYKVKLVAFKGLNAEFALSVVTVALATGLFFGRQAIIPTAKRLDGEGWGPASQYQRGLNGFLDLADRVTNILQNGNLRYYLNTIVGTLVVLTGFTFLSRSGWTSLITDLPLSFTPEMVYEIVLGIIIIVAALSAVRATSRLASIASLGIIGFCIAIFYALFSAPDLAMTQFSVETLSVVLIALIIGKLPRYFKETSLTSRPDRLADVLIAAGAGTLISAILLVTLSMPLDTTLADYFGSQSYTAAKGSNVVNVILVDFRGLDTLGEIAVLAIAGIGVYVLSHLRLGRRRDINTEEPEG